MNKDMEILISPGLWSKKQKIIILVIFVILLFSGGFIAGTYVTIKAVADVAVGFVDEELIQEAIFRYKNQIKSRFPSLMPNASNYWDEGE